MTMETSADNDETVWRIEVWARHGRRQWRPVSGHFKFVRAAKAAAKRQRSDPGRTYRIRHRFTDDVIMADIL